jgi:small ligand-binding sensory domain FIST
MAVRIGTALSTRPDPLDAGVEAATQAMAALDGSAADLVLMFATGAHLAAPEATLEAVQEASCPTVLLGCGAGGVLGERRELESGTALAVWAASFDTGEVTPFHLRFESGDDPARITGLPDIERSRGLILIADPYSFPTDALLSELALQAPGVPILGGLQSARAGDEAALLFGDEVRPDGAVGVSLEDVELLPCVSQGAAPIGPELTVTAAEGNVIEELAGRPALETLQRVVGQLSDRERALVAGGLLIGIVVDPGKAEYQQGDFLVRGIAGADPDSGRLAVAAEAHDGQVIRLHARDARSAHEDLQRQLRLCMDAAAHSGPAGALVFSCNGRGAAMFGPSDHDAATVAEELGEAPAAGFFAAGEIGPVGGRSFLHGFTATVGVFPR